MEVYITIYLINSDAEAVKSYVNLKYIDGQNVVTIDKQTDIDGSVTFCLPETAVPILFTIQPITPGYWSLIVERNVHDGIVIVCPRLRDNVAIPAWWHRGLGVDCTKPMRGTGIRIGVVDSLPQSTTGLEHVRFLDAKGNVLKTGDVVNGDKHGEFVCRIIGNRSANGMLSTGIAPGADIRYVAASSRNEPKSVDKFITAVFMLLLDEDVHIINMSFGHRDKIIGNDNDLRAAVSVARKKGVLCVAAAGNDGEPRVMLPAAGSDCIAVGALGCMDWGPEDSAAAWYRQLAVREQAQIGQLSGCGEVFRWPASNFGRGLDMMAPGVGIVVSRDGDPVWDMSGTSFAAPMVCGLLAVALASDSRYLTMGRVSSRWDYARQFLVNLCQPIGIDERYAGKGVPQLQSTEMAR